MSNKNKDIWIMDKESNYYKEMLFHTFKDSEIIFQLSRKGRNHIEDPLLLSISGGLTAGDNMLTIKVNGDILHAKSGIENAINYFDKQQTVNIYQIKGFLSMSYQFTDKLSNSNKSKTMSPELQSANGFVNYFLKNENKQGENISLERNNFNSKENFMSDERQEVSDQVDDYLSELNTTSPIYEGEKKEQLRPEQKLLLDAAHQRKVVADSIKAGTLCCLPGADGYADTTPTINIMNPDKSYHGANLLYLKEHQRQNGFPTGEYITLEQINNAKKDNPDLFIRKDQKSISIHVSEKIEGTEEYQDKRIILFNVAQLNKPSVIKHWAEQKVEEKAQEKIAYLKTQYGSNWKPPAPKQKETGPEIVCNSTEPEKYLGQYLAAISMGSKFKVSSEQAAEFSEKMINSLYEPWINKNTGEPYLGKEGQSVTNPYKLEDISREAGNECKTFVRDLRISLQNQNKPEQKQEQTQSLGRGM